MKQKINDWMKLMTSLPEFSHSIPGFPLSPPPVPYCIQFYRRDHFPSTMTYLHDRYNFICPVEGSLCFEVDHQLFKLEKWQCSIIFPGDRLKLFEGPQGEFTALFISFYLKDDKNILNSLRFRNLDVNGSCRRQLFKAVRIFNNHYPRQNVEEYSLSCCLGEFFEMLRIKNTSPPPDTFQFRNYTDDGSELFRRISQIIAEDPARKITIRDLSRQLGVSASHLRKNFKKKIGRSLGAYLRSCRMQTAIQLLRSSDKNIEEIAQLCGYSSTAAFSRAFKNEEKHDSPLAYRNRIRKSE